MKKHQPFSQTLCLRFCAYYKPEKKEELACRGYAVAEQIMRSVKAGCLDTFKKRPDPLMVDAVIREVCVSCDFFEKDCDFMQDRTAPPCGGMVVLTQLLNMEQISLNDLETANRTCKRERG